MKNRLIQYVIEPDELRLQHRHRVHRQAAGHHAVPRALLRGGGHGPPRRLPGPVCGLAHLAHALSLKDSTPLGAAEAVVVVIS